MFPRTLCESHSLLPSKGTEGSCPLASPPVLRGSQCPVTLEKYLESAFQHNSSLGDCDVQPDLLGSQLFSVQ